MKRYALPILMVLSLLLSGCGIFPKEEVYQSAPTIANYQREEWKFAYVRRDDMVLSQSVVCTYVPVQTQTLSFSVSGLIYDTVFVSVGDSVQKGQLLAQLDISGIQQSKEEHRWAMEKAELQLGALEENRQLELQREKLLLADSKAKDLEAALKKINDRYDLEKQAIQDEWDIAKLAMEECDTLIKNRQLYAQIDGTVTYARAVKPGDRSVADEQVVTIENSVSSIFQAETKYWASVVPGQTYTITVRSEEYEAVAVSEAELGLEESVKADGFPATVYLALQDNTAQLEDGDRGMLELVLDSREDVLVVPDTAVTKKNGRTIVYYQDENGLKMYKTVEIGLTANGMTEIISGLAEGECIIAG